MADSAAETVTEAQAALAAGRFGDAAGLYRALAEGGGGASARVAEAIAYYEVGDLNSARYAVDLALDVAPKDTAAQNVKGLLLVDGGDVQKGIEMLKAAKASAHAAGRKASEARAGVNLARAWLDTGDTKAALTEADTATKLAGEAGESAVVAAAGEVRAAVALLEGTDSEVGALLGKGQTGSARRDLQDVESRDERQVIVLGEVDVGEVAAVFRQPLRRSAPDRAVALAFALMVARGQARVGHANFLRVVDLCENFWRAVEDDQHVGGRAAPAPPFQHPRDGGGRLVGQQQVKHPVTHGENRAADAR